MHTEVDTGSKGPGGTKPRAAKDPNTLTPTRLKELALLPEPSTNASKERVACHECGRFTECSSPFVREEASGWTGNLLLLFGQRPSQEALDYVISLALECGHSESDLWFFDAVACGGRKPTTKQLRACRPFFVELILKYKPQSVLAFGDVALRYATDNGKLKNITENRGRSFMVPGCEGKTHVFCTYDADSIIDGSFHNRERVKEDFLRVREGGLRRLSTPHNEIPSSPEVGVDTEFMPDGQVVTLSVSDTHDSACSDVSESTSTKRLLRRISTARSFVGHQVTVDLDSVLRLARQHSARIKPLEGWLQGRNITDTMALARMVDENRPKGGYKLEVLLRSGHRVAEWKDDNESRDLANPESWDKDYRVERCRLDAWAASVLAEKLRADATGPLELTHRIIQTLRRIYHTGAYVDLAYAKKISGEFFADSSKAKRKLLAYASRYGMVEFSPTNDNHLRELLFEHCGLKATEKTKTTGVASVNKTFLKNNSKSEVVKTLLEFNTADKRHSTYGVGLAKKFLGTRDPRFAMLRFRVNPLGARTGRRASDKPNCFDGATEVLTEQGWQRLDSWDRSPIAQWEDGHITFAKADFVTKTNTDDLYYYRNQHISLQVTGDHRCLLQHRKTGEYRVFKGSDYPQDWKQLHGGYFKGGKGLPLTEDEIRLAVVLQADGHYTKNGKWQVSLRSARKRHRFMRLALRLGLGEGRLQACGRRAWYFSYDVSALLECPSKTFVNVFHSTKRQMCVFAAEVQFWDGSWSRPYGSRYASANKENAVTVQTAYALLNRRAKLRVYTQPNGVLNYQVDVTRRSYSLTSNVACTRVSATRVYCVSVPSSYVLVRRDGCISVTGQCQNWPKDVRKIVVSRFGGYIFDSDYSKLEVILFAFIAREWKLLEFFLEGNGYIAVGKELFNKEVKEDTDEYRSVKSVVLGVQYGMGAYKLAYQLWNSVGVKLSSDWEEHVEQAQRIRQKYLDKFPGIPRYIWNQKRALLRDHQVSSLTGRVRHLPCPYGEDTPGFGHLLNQAINFPIQSLASDCTGSAMVDIEAALLDKYKLTYEEYHWMLMEGKYPNMPLLINEVHDSLVYDIPIKGAKQNIGLIEEIQKAVPTLRKLLPAFDVPLNTGGKLGYRWSDNDVKL